MQSNRSSDSTLGGGIYEARARRERENEDDDNRASPRAAILERPQEVGRDVNNNPVSRVVGQEFELLDDEDDAEDGDLALSERKFDDILSVLDQQVATLNELRQQQKRAAPSRQFESTKSFEGIESPNELVYERLFSKKQTSASKSAPPRDEEPDGARKSVLENYVRNNIAAESNCGCHFHFGPGELKLLDELNECYRKFCQFNSAELAPGERSASGAARASCEQQVTKEGPASDFIGGGREIGPSGADCGVDRASASHCDAAARRASSSSGSSPTNEPLQGRRRRRRRKQRGTSTHNDRGLFIEESQSLPTDSGRAGASSETTSTRTSAGRERRRRRRHGRLGDQLSERQSWSDSEINSARAGRTTTSGSLAGAYCASRRSLQSAAASSSSASTSLLSEPSIGASHLNNSGESGSLEHESSPEYEQQSALVGVEESPWPPLDSFDAQLNWRAEFFNKRKRAKSWAESWARPKRRKQISSSSLETSCTDYQLGCSLTNDSNASHSPFGWPPCDLDEAASDSSLASDELTAADCCDRYQIGAPDSAARRQVGGGGFTSDASGRRIFQQLRTRTGHSSQSGCSSFAELGAPQSRAHCNCCAAHERHAAARSAPLHHCCSAPNGRSAQLSPASSTTSLPQTMDPDERENRDNRDNSSSSGGKLKGARKVKNNAPRCNGPAEANPVSRACGASCAAPRSLPESGGRADAAAASNGDADDSSRLRLGTNAKTRLQQGGVEIPPNCLRARNSADSSGPEAAAPAAASMKTAKDIVKLSIPSLAALQYLPGQLDVRGGRSIDRLGAAGKERRAANTLSSGAIRRSNSMSQSARVDAPSAGAGATPSVVAEGNELRAAEEEAGRRAQSEEAPGEKAPHHDDSCLLHRLCLCNCLARSHNAVKKLRSREGEAAAAAAAARDSLSPSPTPPATSQSTWLKRARAAKNVAGRASVSPGLLSSTSDETEQRRAPGPHLDVARDCGAESSEARARGGGGRDEGAQTRAIADEKQSPSFMGLLKPAGRQAQASGKRAGGRESSSEKYEHLRALAQQRTAAPRRPTQQSRLGAAPATVNSDGLGSIGDLVASGRSSASDSHASECSPIGRATGAGKIASSGELLSDDSCNCQLPHTDDTKPTGSSNRFATSPSPSETGAKRVPAYKKFLSPRRLLFNSSTSSINECEPAGRQHERASFLSRSLSRLSGRRRQRAASSGASNNQEAAEAARAASPAVSVSNNSCADSLEDDVHLSHSLPFAINDELLGKDYHGTRPARLQRAPDIVLSRVEFQQELRECTRRSCPSDMPHQHHHHHGHQQRPASAQSARNHDRQLVERLPHQRHGGSELSFDSASELSGSGGAHQGPFSLPGSPKAQRRRRNRSPRLSHSPVPFHAPANQSSRIEDGLRVCSTEHFEKHIGNIKDDQVEAQKRLFTAWINHFAPNLIRHDLFVELQDGIKLIGMLATLTHDKQLLSQYERLNRDKQSYIHRLTLTPSSRLKHLSNVSIAIDYLRTKLGMKLVNLNPMDVVSGKANVILGLCWSIILNFQFDGNFLKSSDSSSGHSSNVSQATSPFSSSRGTGEIRARTTATSGSSGTNSAAALEEFTTRDLAHARSRMLEHINKRFNLKLTNLTSSLLDGDVLLAIIKHLLASNVELNLSKPGDARHPERSWNELDEDEKLDCAFRLAQQHLGVPQLISAVDLRRQTLGEHNSKPLLVYLSMLLKANPRNCSTDQMLELRQLDESLKKAPENERAEARDDDDDAENDHDNVNSTVARALESLSAKDRFYIDKLQATLSKIREIGSIINATSGEQRRPEGAGKLDRKLVRQYLELKRQAEQVEFLIEWINKADGLFQGAPRSSGELARAINSYQQFFSPASLPKVDTSLCPTLERQYRECLATAKQRVMSMEQTMKNWISYDQASQDLKKWLMTAEAKLTEALRPNQANHELGGARATSAAAVADEQPAPNPVDLHMSRLDDLIEYFELEPIDMDDFDDYISSLSPNYTSDSLAAASIGQTNRSLSGSLISLGSTGSRVSALTSSKKAAYNKLFDEFELKCRLLAAMLEPEQRDELLLGVKELKAKLKYITEYKVPQVISEIRMSISRCEMSIQEQDENCTESEDDERANRTSRRLSDQIVAGKDEERDESATSPSTGAVSDDCALASDEPLEAAHESVAARKRNTGNGDLGKEAPGKQAKRRNRSKSRNSKSRGNKAKPSKGAPIVQTAIRLTKGKSLDDGDNDLPYLKRFWNKIVRASKLSLSFNIVLLICLAGICVVPLIQRDACCELSQAPIASDKFTVNQRPT